MERQILEKATLDNMKFFYAHLYQKPKRIVVACEWGREFALPIPKDFHITLKPKNVDYWVDVLNQKEKITAKRFELNEAGQPVPRVLVNIQNSAKIQLTEALLNHEPSIAVLANDADSFYISPDLLNDEEIKIVSNAIIKIFA